MHQQIRTSPGATGENIRRVLDVLAAAGVNIEGIGPDYESPHVRTAVPDTQFEAAWAALKAAGLEPEQRAAITFALSNVPGELAARIEQLARRGYAQESVLVLASRHRDQTLVSIGVRRTVPNRWETTVIELGGWEEPDGWKGGDVEQGA